MNKKKNLVFVFGGFSVAICLVLAIFLTLILKEQIFPRKIPITITTKNGFAFYSNTPLTAEEYVLHGELREGDVLDVRFTQSQTLVGACENTADVIITDANGVEATNRYQITIIPGTLTVEPRLLSVTTSSGEKVYDGTPLTAESGRIEYGELVEGHTASFLSFGSQEGVGKSLNNTIFTIADEKGNDVTDQYAVSYALGTLTVTPKKLAIIASDAEKVYDGTPLSSSKWSMNGTLCSGHTISVSTGGSQTSVGASENMVYLVQIYENRGNNKIDVSANYEISCYNGLLVVRAP